MKRVLTALFSAALLFGPAVSANAAPAVPGVCNKAAMNKIFELGYVWDTPWDRCQFKLFYPDGSLSWNENEWFQGNDFFSVPVTSPTSPSQAILHYYAQIEEHLYWGMEPTPLWALTEKVLSRGPIRSYVDSCDGPCWARGTYFNFPPKKAGHYKWRYTYVEHICLDDEDPCSGDVTGHITIEPAPVIGPAS